MDERRNELPATRHTDRPTKSNGAVRPSVRPSVVRSRSTDIMQGAEMRALLLSYPNLDYLSVVAASL